MNIIEEVGITSKTQAELPYVQVNFNDVRKALLFYELNIFRFHCADFSDLLGPRELRSKAGLQEQ